MSGVPGRGGTGGVSGGVAGQALEFPCEWVKSVDEARAKLGSARTLLYLLFQKEAPRPAGSFQANPTMQKISQEVLVFVLLTVDKKPSDDMKALMKRCKVTRLPTAVIADEHGNPLFVGASTTDAKKLTDQVKTAKATQVKVSKGLDDMYAKALRLSREQKFSLAAEGLSRIKKEGLVGLAVLAKVDELVAQIDGHFVKQLEQIDAQNLPRRERREALQALKAQAHRDLPVYERIVAAYREAL